MGGNAKYRSHTAVIRNPYNESGFQAMRDSNGKLIRIPESERVVGKDKRTANRANAKERMLNAQALNEIRDLARSFRVSARRAKANKGYSSKNEMDEQRNNLMKLANIANQIQPGAASDLLKPNPNAQDARKAAKEIEKVLGVKLIV